MSQDKDREFLQHLIEATATGRIAWEPTANLDEFTTSFRGKYSVIVYKRAQDYYTLRMLDESEREMLKLDYPVPEYPIIHPFSGIKELFELARRRALHVEEAMTDILTELKQ